MLMYECIPALEDRVGQLKAVVEKPRRKMSRAARRVLLSVMSILGVALYLNIGWAIGTYYHENVKYTIQKTTTAKIAAGGWAIYSRVEVEDKSSLQLEQVEFSLVWPAFVVMIGFSWLAFGAWKLLVFVWWLAYWLAYKLLWLVFAGGIAKLLGAS